LWRRSGETSGEWLKSSIIFSIIRNLIFLTAVSYNLIHWVQPFASRVVLRVAKDLVEALGLRRWVLWWRGVMSDAQPPLLNNGLHLNPAPDLSGEERCSPRARPNQPQPPMGEGQGLARPCCAFTKFGYRFWPSPRRVKIEIHFLRNLPMPHTRSMLDCIYHW